MAPVFRIETAFMRGLAKTLASEIGFSPAAELQMTALGVFWPEIHQVLRSGRVTWSDKEEADGAKSIMIGTCCDGVRLCLTLHWSYAPARVLVANVQRI